MNHEEVRRKLAEDQGRPCLSMPAVLFLRMILTPSMTVLETGAGRSTIWIAERVKSIYSLESKEEWADCVRESLKAKGLTNAVVVHDSKFPQYFHNFSKYFGSLIDSFDMLIDSFDMVFLDGSDLSGDRVMCMKSGYKYVKPGGYLMVDDSHRVTYEEGIRVCRGTGWPRMDFWGYGFHSENPKLCSVWRRPE